MMLPFEREQPPKTPDVFVFELPQADGSIVKIDLSIWGEFGDLAFFANKEYFSAYWTAESTIFVDLLQRLSSRPAEELPRIKELIERHLIQLSEDGYGPTTEGEGIISEDTVRMLTKEPVESSRVYPMFGGGDATLAIDISQDDGVHMTSNRAWDDGMRKIYEFVIPDSELWRFVAGMVARSFSKDGEKRPALTRYATTEFNNALRVCLPES